jgi:excinuclease ABC subunit C
LFVLQHIRDEAHRTAVRLHRKTREKRAFHSPLDDVPGVGPARKKALLKRFGSLAKLREATTDEIAQTPGIGPEVAAAVHDQLHEVAAGERRASA